METVRNDSINEINSNKSNLLRFIIITSIGFAVGGVIAFLYRALLNSYFFYITGLHVYFEFNYQFIDLIPYAIWGIIGGLAIGIAAKKDKKLYMLLGGTGFGIGFAVSVFYGVWSDWSHGIGGAAGVIIGIFEGISLSLYYRSSKSIGVLSICGLAGFGVGGMAGIMTYKVTFDIVTSTVSNELVQLLIVYLIAFVVTGLIGGSALGCGIYFMHKSNSAGGREICMDKPR